MRKREKDVCGGLRSGRLSGIISPLSLSHRHIVCVFHTQCVCLYCVFWAMVCVCVRECACVCCVCACVFTSARVRVSVVCA